MRLRLMRLLRRGFCSSDGVAREAVSPASTASPPSTFCVWSRATGLVRETKSLSAGGAGSGGECCTVASGLTRRRSDTRSFRSSRKAIPTVTSGRMRRFWSRVRRRRFAGRGSSSSVSSAERLLPVLKGDEDRDDGCRRVFMIARGAGASMAGPPSLMRLPKALSMLPRHCSSISTMTARSYLPPSPSWIAEIFHGVATSTTALATVVASFSASLLILGIQGKPVRGPLRWRTEE